ncbi:MAG: zinc-ribbon domain-containing protein [Alphaproteobacteria bacterium]|nr:zinc-ribbon domain-containing protein [Alphaproteobacteria bacterium]
MIVTCPSCAARYKLDDSKVTGRGAKITCPSCRYVFIVYPNKAEEEAQQATARASGGSSAVISGNFGARAPAPAQPAAPAAGGGGRRSAEDLDFRKVGIASWKVKVKIGLVYDFSDIKTLRKYIQDGRVTSEDVISHDGKAWATIGDIPDLDAYFIQVYEAAEAELSTAADEVGGSGFEEEDAPTMIVGMSTLSSDLAKDALRQATSGPAPDSGGPATPSDHGQFVDPFAALKSKQRERIQQRRAVNTAPPSTKEEGGGNRAIVVVLVLLLAGAGIGWWYTQKNSVVELPPEPPPKQNTTVEDPGTDPGGESDEARRLREEIERSLRERPDALPPEDDAPPVLIPVGPRDDPRTNGAGTNPGSTDPGGNAAVDHAANCKQFFASRDWQQARFACDQAARGGPTDPNIGAYLGIALYESGDRQGAAQRLNLAERSGASTRQVLKYLGHIARDNGDIPGAVGYYKRYVDTNPSDRAAIEAEIKQLTGS